MDDARRRVAETMDEVRSLGRGIHPTILSQGGLGLALPRLEEVDRAVRVELDPDLRAGGRLDPDVESAVWFSAAELVTNAVRHAGADRILLTATMTDVSDRHYRGGGVLLAVDVTGAAGVDATSRGLVGLRDRVEALGGRVDLGSREGGTAVRVWVPVHPLDAAPG